MALPNLRNRFFDFQLLTAKAHAVVTRVSSARSSSFDERPRATAANSLGDGTPVVA